MKKVGLVLTLVLASVMAVSVTACGGTHKHSYGEWQQVTAPTCTEQGEKMRECTCGDVQTEKIPATGHSYSADWSIGEYKHWHECTVCGDKKDLQDHGFSDKTCTGCGKRQSTQGLEMTLDGEGQSYLVTGIGTATDSEIVIPMEYEGLPVDGIDYQAFKDCGGVTNVIAPDTLKYIHYEAFDGTAFYNDESNWQNGVLYCGKHLVRARETLSGNYAVKEGTLTIGTYAFWNCNEFTGVSFPDSIKYINSSFHNCSKLASINIPDVVVSIGIETFKNTAYYNDESNWQDGLLYIGKHLVAAKSTIEGSVTVKEGTLTVASGTFYENSELTSVAFPESLKFIGNAAFAYCYGLKSVTIPKNVTIINAGAFVACSGLERIEVESGNTVYHSAGNCLIDTKAKTLIAGCKNSLIPDDGSVEIIGYGAFALCRDLKSITVPDGVKSIGIEAFSACGLTSITIAGSVTSIESIALGGCEALKDINYNGTKAQWNAIEKGNRWGMAWDMMTGDYTVHCTDGDIAKA